MHESSVLFLAEDLTPALQRKLFNDTCSVKRLYLRSIKTPRYPTKLQILPKARESVNLSHSLSVMPSDTRR